MKLFARRALALLAWSPLLLTAAGCGNQGEGERCSQTHGNIDCDEGLTCKQVYVQTYHFICCPVPPAPVSVAACNASGIPPSDGGTTFPPDAAADARQDGSGDTGARDLTGNDAVDEPSDDGSTLDRAPDVSPDISIDTATPDVRADAAGDASDAPGDLPTDQTSADGSDDSPPVDAPPDTAPDAPADVTTEALPDGPDLDTMTPIDVGDVVDAPAEGGPG